VDFFENDPLPNSDGHMHHYISDSKKHGQDAFSFGKSFPDDPATKVGHLFLDPLCEDLTIYPQDFIPKLKDHLLGRLLHHDFDGDECQFSDADRNTVRIHNNRIYSAKVLRVNYTTYDVRRGQDTLNPRTNSDVMVLSADTTPGAHPYWYAHILGVFHAQILHTGPAATN
jgi:hypothetical protein